MPLYKNKKFIIIACVVSVLVASIAYGQYKKMTAPAQYETAKAIRGDIKQSVEATGKMLSADDIKLRFEMSGTIGAINLKEGDEVKQGDIIMSLKAAELDAAVAQASANLNQRLAGATPEDIVYYQSAVDLAKAALDAAKDDKDHSIAVAEFAVQNALNNLKLADGGENSVIVTNAYESAVAVINGSMTVVENSLTQADNILGVDNAIANDDFEPYLSLLDTSILFTAKDFYKLTRDKIPAVRDSVSKINLFSPKSDIDETLNMMESALSDSMQLLSLTRDVLNATAPVGNLTQTSLDSKKTTIETARSNAASQYNSALTARQNITTAKNSHSTYEIAYEKAKKDLDNVKKSADTNIAIKEASHNQALANLNSKKNPPREVDVAALRAALSQTLANRAKAVLRAPIDGIVTKIHKKVGEFVSITEMAVDILSPHFEIEVDIPETDVVKLNLGNEVMVTLDAYGDDVKFNGKIISIDPASTVIQDVVYYKVTVALDDSDKEIKSGMTANVTIGTAEVFDIIHIPSRAVRTDDEGKKFVKILLGGAEVDKAVLLGLRADNGFIEIKSGLNEGDEVIIRKIENK